jgi:hypothetical protein
VETEIEVHVDRSRPPRITFDDSGGQPILAYHAGDEPGWILYVQHFQPFPMGVAEFDGVFEALANANRFLESPLPDAFLLPIRRLTLRCEHRPDGNSFDLEATLDADGTLTLRGHNIGPLVAHGDYEYWYTVTAEHVPALVVALGGEPGTDIIDVMQRRGSGIAALEIRKVIEHSEIEYEFGDHY